MKTAIIACTECRGENPDCVFCNGTGQIRIGGQDSDGQMRWPDWILLALGAAVCVGFWWAMYHLWEWL